MGTRRTSGWLAAALVGLVATSMTAGAGVAAPGSAGGSGVGGARSAATGAATPGERGTWQIVGLGGDRYRVAWTSPQRLPIGADRPAFTGLTGVMATTPTIAADGRTVEAVVTAGARPDPAALDVVLSGDRLDHAGDDRLRRSGRSAPGAAALDLPGTETLAVDPGVPGPHAVVTSDYELDPLPLEGMPEPIEMIGHVVEPAADAATGPRPLVLFLHGRHETCYDPADPDAWPESWPCEAPFKEIPSHRGYDYIQRVLASQGYATVSIRANGINAQDFELPDGGAGARAALVEAHLDHWTGLAAEHQLDLDRVVLVGHSRGGEGVDRAAIRIPLDAAYRIAGQVLVAPTNFGTQTAPYVPTVTLLPYCDGDVFDLQGQRFTDAGRDLVADDTSLKSSVLVMGANHNYFNTEWTERLAEDSVKGESKDDWWGEPDLECGKKHPERLTAGGQRAVGLAYVAGAVHLFAEGEREVLPLFDGSRARVASQGAAQTLSHAVGGGRDVRRPDLDAARSLADGAETRTCRGTLEMQRMASCGFDVDYAEVAPHWPAGYETVPVRKELEVAWTARGQSGGLRLDDPLDLSTRRLELRAIADPEVADTAVRIRITDADGASATLTPEGGGRLPQLGVDRQVRKLWAQTIVVDPAPAADEVDLGRIVQVDLVGQSPRGRVWLLDLAAATDELAAVPATRLPLVDLGRLRVDEGDGKRPVIARLPVRIVGELTRPARIMVLTAGMELDSTQRFTIDLAAGQTSGSIPVRYQPNKLDDHDETITDASAWAVRNVMTDNYIGRLTVVDDDPAPKVTVTVPRKRIRDGQEAVWRVRLSERVNYDYFLRSRIVRGPRPVARVRDLDPQWVELFIGFAKPETPLWKTRTVLYDSLPPGQKVTEIRIPTLRTPGTGPTKSLTLRHNLDGRMITRTVKIQDR